MELEFAIEPGLDDSYPFLVQGSEPFVVDWRPMIEAIVEEIGAQCSAGAIAAKFHNTLAEMIVAVARRIEQERVVLTGGCFQNCQLTERCVERLIYAGFRPYWHQRVPPNDGGIALGQIVAASLAAVPHKVETKEVLIA